MLLFSRNLLLAGDPRETRQWVREVTEHVRSKTGRDVSVWSALAGAPIGTTAFTMLVESRAQLAAATQPLTDDDEYHDIVNRGRKFFSGPPEDTLVRIVHLAGEGDVQLAPVGSAVSLVSAQIATGKHLAAIRWGAEMADLQASISGGRVGFCVNVAGTFGGVQWIQTAPDIATQEAWEQRILDDERYGEKLSEIGGMYVEGSGNRILARRVF